jgi:N-acyl amino acid synthase of PEP-CTERM/exosortase system
MSISIGPYEIQIATTSELKDAVYRLRYQVYCLESEFENPADFADQRERDSYEEQSIHVLISHKGNADLVGTVRLIFATSEAEPFHFEQLSQQQATLPKGQNRSHYAEISRLALASQYRNESKTELVDDGQNKTILPGTLLYACVMAITDILSIESVALLEPRLATYLNDNGITSQVVGKAMEHNGLRVPYLLDFHCRERNQKDKLGQLYQLIKKALYQDVIDHQAANQLIPTNPRLHG